MAIHAGRKHPVIARSFPASRFSDRIIGVHFAGLPPKPPA